MQSSHRYDLDVFWVSQENSEPSRSLSSVVLHLSQLLKALLPAQHLVKEEEGTSASRLRGNLALLFGQLSEMQAANEDAAVWKVQCRRSIDVLMKYDA